MNALMARLSMRLVLPAARSCGLAAPGGPLPAPTGQRFKRLSRPLLRKGDSLMKTAGQQGDAIRRRGQTATAMRLLKTRPAFTRRCITSCTD